MWSERSERFVVIHGERMRYFEEKLQPRVEFVEALLNDRMNGERWAAAWRRYENWARTGRHPVTGLFAPHGYVARARPALPGAGKALRAMFGGGL